MREDFIDRLLLAYAAGSLGMHETLVVAALLALNGEARGRVAHYEAFGGRVLEEQLPAAVHSRCLDSVLKRISGDCAAPCPPPSAREYQGVPEPLSSLLNACVSVEAGNWLRGRDGIERLVLHMPAPTTQKNLFLVRLGPGGAVPAHAHGGTEMTLVLDGSYHDIFGHYKKGDISIVAAGSVPHSPVADAGGCLCLMLTEGPLYFISPVRQWFMVFLQRF